MAKDKDNKDAAPEKEGVLVSDAPATTEETGKKKRPPRMVDENFQEREPIMVVDVKESTLPAAIKFITKALTTLQGDEYAATSCKGVIKVYADEAE